MTLETCPTCRGMGQWLNQPVCPGCNGTGDVWEGGKLFPVIRWTPEMKADAAAFTEIVAPHAAGAGVYLPPDYGAVLDAADAPHIIDAKETA